MSSVQRLTAVLSSTILRLVLLAVAGALVAGAIWITRPLPADLLANGFGAGIAIEDRNGLPLRSTRAADGSSVIWVRYEQIDADVINAFVATEDRRFWDHHGVDVAAVLRAARDNLMGRRVVSGASTITMQLARLLRPVERDWSGKFAQLAWALRIERGLGKQQILEQYLNRVHLGQGTVGIAAASALYFASSASELSIGQAAVLAGLAHAPSRDNPHASLERARGRRAVALGRMQRLGLVTREEVARTAEEPLAAGRRTSPFLAPHFTTRVLSWTTAGRAGTSSLAASTIRTSVDVALQSVVESEVRHTVDMLRERGVAHAAVVVLENETGEVLAWVGSPDFWASEDGQTDMVVSPRQPGSALKPFLFGLAFDRGYTAATVLPDVPKSYGTATGPYRPRNYDRRFRGPVRAREALASSYNVPAVELASRLGASNLLHTLHLAGFESLARDAEHYGLGLALGNGDVTLIELANGYRALANGGEWRPWRWRPVHGERAAPASHGYSEDARRVMSPMASALVLDILQDPVARTPGFGLSTPFDFPFPVAVKTGTSRHFTDNWAVGVTRGYTVAVWAGNFSGRPMEGVSGVAGAGPLLHRVVMAVSGMVNPGAFTTPAELGAVSVPVCQLSGLRAARACRQMTEWFAPGTEPDREDDWESGGRITLPDEYAEWAQQGLTLAAEGVMLPSGRQGLHELTKSGGEAAAELRDGAVGTTEGDSAREAERTRFRILSPLDGDRYSIPPDMDAKFATISLRAAGSGSGSVQWLINGERLAAGRWTLVPGIHRITAVSSSGDTATAKIEVRR